MIKRLKKKAFTLVELLVVIAILAILATAGIVGYTSFTKKAEISNDNSLVAELNNYVVAAKVSKDFNTVSEVRDELVPSGIDLAKLTPSAKNHGYSYGFDIKDDKFVLLEGTSLAEGYSVDKTIDVFVLVKNEAKAIEYMNAGYSVYLQAGYDKTTVNASKGVDVGNNTSITAINYANTNQQTVVIRTNSFATTLTINAPKDTVKHYGEAEKVDVVAIANASYHENGTVQLIAVKEGHVKLEGDADVNGVYVYTDNASAGFEDIKITVDAGVEVPKLSRSAVVIADEGTKVCTVVTDQAKDIYLFNEGIYEQIKTVDAGKEITDSSAAWADSSANTANTQTAAQQLANELNATFTVDETTYAVTVNTETRELVVTNTTTSETVNDTNIIAEATSEAGKTAEEAQAASALKGSGTEADPFLVYDYETMQKISDFYDLGEYYFKVAIEKTDNGHINCDDWESIKLNGSFDGNGVVFDNLDAPLFNRTNSSNISTIGNFTADCNIVSQTGRAAICTNSAFNTLFHDITVTGYIEGQGQTAAVVSYPGSGVTEFKNVNVSADIVSLGDAGAAAFVINPYKLLSGYGGNSNSKLIFDDCHYSGKMSATGTCKFFYVHTTTVPVEIKNINSNEFGGAVNTYNRYALSEQSSVISIVDIDINEVAAGDNFVFDKLSASAVTCTVTIGISPNGTDETGSFTGVYLKDSNIELGDDGKFHTTNAVKITSASVNDNNKVAGLNDLDSNGKFEHYNIISSVYGTTHNGGFVTVIQYDSRGNVVAYASATLFDANN